MGRTSACLALSYPLANWVRHSQFLPAQVRRDFFDVTETYYYYYYWWGGTESLGICSSP
jgi:hypothetical protein